MEVVENDHDKAGKAANAEHVGLEAPCLELARVRRWREKCAGEEI